MREDTQLVISLLTIILSGIGSAYVSHRLNTKKDERYVLRQKLEDLNIAIIGYCNQVAGSYWLPSMGVMAGRITFNAANDILNKSNDTEKNYDRISMIVNIYFPSLSPYLDDIHKARDMGDETISDFRRGYRSGVISSQEHLNKMQQASSLLDKAETDFKNAIRDEAMKLR